MFAGWESPWWQIGIFVTFLCAASSLMRIPNSSPIRYATATFALVIGMLVTMFAMGLFGRPTAFIYYVGMLAIVPVLFSIVYGVLSVTFFFLATKED